MLDNAAARKEAARTIAADAMRGEDGDRLNRWSQAFARRVGVKK
jgi:hypothetical protein